MKMQLAQIYSVQPILKKLVEQDIPIKTSYKLGKIVKKIDEEFKSVEEQ